MRLLQTTGKKVTDNAGTTTTTYTFGASLTPGSTVIASLAHFGGIGNRVTALTASGTSGAKDKDQSDGANANHAEVWSVSNVAGGNANLALTVSSSGSYISASAEEWRGFLQGTSFDQSGGTAQTTSAAPAVTAAGATADAFELAYAVFCDYVGSNWTSGSGPSGGTNTYIESDGSTHEAGGAGYVPLSTVQTPTLTFTTGASMAYIAALATYKVYFPKHDLKIDFINAGGSSITTPAMLTQSSPGAMLAFMGRGAIGDYATATVSDNKGNGNYSQLGSSHAYTNWPTSGTAVFYKLNPAGGSGHTVSASKPSVNDEVSLIAVEVPAGFNSIQDSSWVEDLTSPNTSSSVTTTGAAWLFAFWSGDNVNGETNPIPDTGWYKLEWSSSLASNHVQVAAFAKYVSSAGTYSINVTPGTSQGAQLWLVALQVGVSGPTINTQPTNQTGSVGGTAGYSVSATAGAGSLTYQWRKDGSNISGATSSSYTTPTIVAGDNGSLFDCVVTDSNGSTTTNAVLLFVRDIVTGKGRDLKSTWALDRRASGFTSAHSMLRKKLGPNTDTDQIRATVFLDWFLGIVGGSNTYDVSLTEAATAADSLIAALVAANSVSESGTAAATFAVTSVIGTAVTEAGTAADAAAVTSAIGVSVTEAGTAADAAAVNSVIGVSVTEAATLADALATLATFGLSLTESGTAAVALANTAVLAASLSEASSAADAVSQGGSVFSTSVSESASAGDALATVAALNSSVTEAGTAADALATIATLNVSLTEASTAADAVNQGGSAYNVSLSESVTAADALATVATFVKSLSEAASAADSLATVLQAVNALTESASAADAVAGSSGGSTYNVTLSEASSAGDVASALTVFGAAIIEAASSQDSLQTSISALSALIEAAAAGDLVQVILPITADDPRYQIHVKGRKFTIRIRKR